MKQFKGALLNHITLGAVSYLGFLYLTISQSIHYDNGLFSGQNLMLVFVLLSGISGYILSLKFNQSDILPLHHPVVLFIRVILSKRVMFPSIFYPLGVLLGYTIGSVILNRVDLLGFFKLGSMIFLGLYFAASVGAFSGIVKINRR